MAPLPVGQYPEKAASYRSSASVLPLNSPDSFETSRAVRTKSTTKQISNTKRITNGPTYIRLARICNKLRSFSEETTREAHVFPMLLETQS
jgi:hypothetical protein